jgi:hypothetical protein
MTAGLGLLGVSATVVIASVVTGNLAGALAETGSLMILGAGLFTVGAARLPGWAKTRRRQMEGVAARLALATESPEKGALSAGDEQEAAGT